MSWVRQRWDVRGGALVMLGIKLRDTCAILDKPLREISGPNDPYHIVAIKRRNENHYSWWKRDTTTRRPRLLL